MSSSKNQETKVNASMVNRVKEQFTKERYKTQEFTDPFSKMLAEAGDSKAMGRMGEILVLNQLSDVGFKAKLLNGIEPCDLTMPNGQNIGRLEVKTAKVGYNTAVRKDGTRGKHYSFSQIKPECFDIIFFVFADHNECVVRVGGRKVRDLIRQHGSLQHKANGYCIQFGENKRQVNERGQDDVLVDLTAENIKKMFKS
tara:strand:+ start:1413 stop:2006 length:594 start_codon:yes stop_codon:yes gene_type:complete